MEDGISAPPSRLWGCSLPLGWLDIDFRVLNFSDMLVANSAGSRVDRQASEAPGFESLLYHLLGVWHWSSLSTYL